MPAKKSTEKQAESRSNKKSTTKKAVAKPAEPKDPDEVVQTEVDESVSSEGGYVSPMVARARSGEQVVFPMPQEDQNTGAGE